ncbi:MAG: CoA-binding protein [candidate division Zixibacteria bacterium]|nr:CoA-binding protein [candidate division Zixibacteria bacterium]
MEPSPSRAVAIIGASHDRRKYGNKAVRAYVQSGWTVYPVHPTARKIEGLTAYHSIRDVPLPVDRVSIYLPPPVGVTLLPEIAAAQPGKVFFNPGSESPELLAQASKLGLNAVAACSLVAIGLTPEAFPSE